jgi:isopentenyldiphosphate isomerase
MTEMLDVFDEDEKVIDTLSREFVIKHHLLRRGIWLIVKNSRNEILIHQRSATKSQNPLKWDMKISGYVQSGEEPGHACLREAEEEFGMKGISPIYLFKFLFKTNTANDISYGYKVVYDGTLTPDKEEVEMYEWVTLTRLGQMLHEREFLDSADHIMKNYKEMLG